SVPLYPDQPPSIARIKYPVLHGHLAHHSAGVSRGRWRRGYPALRPAAPFPARDQMATMSESETRAKVRRAGILFGTRQRRQKSFLLLRYQYLPTEWCEK